MKDGVCALSTGAHLNLLQARAIHLFFYQIKPTCFYTPSWAHVDSWSIHELKIGESIYNDKVGLLAPFGWGGREKLPVKPYSAF